MAAQSVTEPRFHVPVRELVEFTAKRGDLDLRFTPSPTAQEGVAGHTAVTRRRAAGYVREVPLTTDHGCLRIAGRADGFDTAQDILEEIKTYRGDLGRMPRNHRVLHWAQLKIYGAMACRTKGLSGITLRLTYFDVDTGTEFSLTEAWTARALDDFLTEHANRFTEWAQQDQAHRTRRSVALSALRFPHVNFNAGQRQLSVAVYRTALNGGQLLVEAPTGIGKTLGTIFPALKAAATDGAVDKIFYLTAKTPGRALALDALRLLRSSSGTNLRVLELTAREKACVHPGLACHGESCPLARGFFDRLAAARSEAVAHRWLDKDAVRAIAASHQVCPYYLSQELIRWADVVVGDYNYYFDASAALHALTTINEWNIVLLVDEAHNLIDRGREMYSANLSSRQFQHIRRSETGAVRRALDRLNRAWNTLARDLADRTMVLDKVPAAFIETLHKTVASLGEMLAEPPSSTSPELLSLFFALAGFAKRADTFGEHSLFVMEMNQQTKRKQADLRIQNVVPASFLAPRLKAAKSAVLFTATLGPDGYFRDMVGTDSQAALVEVASPFRSDQLEVHVAPVSTRYADRDRSIKHIVKIIEQQYRRAPGNYLAFFSSYAYLDQVQRALDTAAPDLPIWTQTARMTEADRDLFLERFTCDGRGIGFVVLGGAFAEGIDLPGTRLVGAFIATLGLPQLNVINEAMKARADAIFGRGAGFDYIYQYPGLRRVIQAAGRVIRTTTDQGVIHLIDDRFESVEVMRHLPRWWKKSARLCAATGITPALAD